MINYRFIELDSLLGKIHVIGDPKGLHEILLGEDVLVMDPLQELTSYNPDFDEMFQTSDFVKAYFNGNRSRWNRIPDGTEFQQAVWWAATRIPYGHTVSYSDLARSIGKPDASRAVGNALGLNPIPILVPCHRIVRSDGGLGGFSSGLELKQKLLIFEQSVLASTHQRIEET